MFHVHLSRKCILLLLDGMFYKYQLSELVYCVIQSLCFLIFCLDDLPIGVSGVLKAPNVVVLLSISPLMPVSVCLMFFSAPMLGA